MNDLSELTNYELVKRLRHAREQLAAAPYLPLEEGFIFQADRDHLQTYWQGQVDALEAEAARRGENENGLLIAAVIAVCLWVLAMAICILTDSWKVFTGILYGGFGMAFLVWGVVWLASKERWWNK